MQDAEPLELCEKEPGLAACYGAAAQGVCVSEAAPNWWTTNEEVILDMEPPKWASERSTQKNSSVRQFGCWRHEGTEPSRTSHEPERSGESPPQLET
jgi:hypothetical protein